MLPFHNYQDDMVDFALSRPGSNLFAAPGLGKTRVTLETIADTDLPALVVAPLLVAKTTWPEEVEKWGYDFEINIMHGPNKRIDPNVQLSIINYDGLPWLAEQIGIKSRGGAFPFQYIVYDEISKLKHPGTGRFKNWRHQMGRSQYRLGLTGTPVGNHLSNLFGEMFAVDLGQTLGRSKDKFMAEYFYQPYAGAWKPLLHSKEKIFRKIKRNARSYDTNLLDMPDLQHIPHYVDLPKSAHSWYAEMKKHSTIEALDMIAVNAGVKGMKSRQLANGAIYDNDKNVVRLHSAKIELLRDIIDELQGQPVLIVYEFDHSLDELKKLLPDNGDFAHVNGSTKDYKAIEIKNQWNAGELSYLAVHPVPCSYGLNLQDSGNHIIFYDTPWSLELVKQAIARLWRQGQTHKVLAHYLCVNGTIDCDILDSVDDKEDLHDDLMEALR